MKRVLLTLAPLTAGLLLLIAALWLAADAESAQSQLGGGYVWLFAVAALAILVLIGAVLREAFALVRDWRMRKAGSRLNARFAMLICLLSVPPTLLVSAFAMRFVDTGIDTWFRADVAASQRSAEDLGREVLGSFERRARTIGASIATDNQFSAGVDPQIVLDNLVARIDDRVFVSMYDESGNLLAIGFNTSAVVLPPPPTDAERLRVLEVGQFAVSERVNDVLVWRILVHVAGTGIVQTIMPLPENVAPSVDLLERTAVDYAQLRYQREAMKTTFVLILGLVSLLALLGSLYTALAATRRLIQPITDLARATTEIAQGRYGSTLPVLSNDEVGFLTSGFNQMSIELLAAEQRERHSRSEIEQSRADLRAVLERLSAGVISFTADRILSANPAAYSLLDVDAGGNVEQCTLAEAGLRFPRGAPLFRWLQSCAAAAPMQWREEIALAGEPSRALLVRGTRLASDQDARFVAVFDDAAVIAHSQREAAWAEVAKRLAHEIKNPLTPIQLAAERLRHKYLAKMTADDAEVLDRATNTIVAQVDALKRIVNAFGDYTRPSSGDRQRFDLGTLLDEVIALYEQSGQCQFDRSYPPEPVLLDGQKERLRQALVNLITNAIEASGPSPPARVDISLQRGERSITLSVRDYGCGLPEGFDERWFLPYNTTKPKGSGLGLATVRKVAEEHGGTVSAHDTGIGSCFVIVLATGS